MLMNLVVDKYKLIKAIILGTLYVASFYPFLLQEFGMMSVFDAVNSPLMLLFDAGAILLGILTLRKRVDCILLVSLLVISYISTCRFNGASVMFWINGLRIYLPLIFVLSTLRYVREEEWRMTDFVKQIDKFLYVYLWAQVPASLIEFAKYGAGDYVGGTFGYMSSGMTSSLIFMISFYLMQRRWNPELTYLQNVSKNWDLLFLLIPTGLNETKISLIYVMLYAIFLLKVDKKFIIRFVLMLPVALLLFAVSVYAYIEVTGNDQYLDMEYMETYAMGNDEMYELLEDLVDYSDDYDFSQNIPDFPRVVKLVMIPMFLNNESYSEMWGFGVGLFKGGTSLEKSKFAVSYEWFLLGTVMQAMIWWLELGLLGLIWALFYLFTLFGVIGPKPTGRNNQLLAFMVVFTIIQIAYSPITSKIAFIYIFVFLVYSSTNWSSLPVYNNPLIRKHKSAG